MECGRNRCRSHFFRILDIWSRSGDIRDRSRKFVKNHAEFWTFIGPPKFQGAGLPEVIHML